MNNLLAEEVGNYESLFCKTQQFSKSGAWRLKMQIDGGNIINGRDLTVGESYSPQISYMFPSGGAPARNRDAPMTENSFWTEWENMDEGQDGNDHEMLGKLFQLGRKVRCQTPIRMEVRDVATNQTFTARVFR